MMMMMNKLKMMMYRSLRKSEKEGNYLKSQRNLEKKSKKVKFKL